MTYRRSLGPINTRWIELISIYQVWFPMIYHMLCRIDPGGASAPKSHVGTWQKRLRSFFTLPLASTSWNFMKLRYLLYTSRIQTTAIYGDLYLHLLGALDNITYYIHLTTSTYSHFSASLPSLCPSFQCCRESGISPRCLKRNLIRKYLYFGRCGTRKLWQKDAKNVPQTSTNTPKAAILFFKFWVTWINLVTFWSCLTHWPVRRRLDGPVRMETEHHWANWCCDLAFQLQEANCLSWPRNVSESCESYAIVCYRMLSYVIVCCRMTVCLKHLTLGKLLCKKHTHYHSLPAQWNAHIFTTMCILPWADLCANDI